MATRGWGDPDRKLERGQILQDLGRKIIGQRAALTAAADVISVAKARLNDPDRPLASFLFLGPTGVGKTQCAKAITEFLFGEAEKMIRFDMNEYISPDAVALDKVLKRDDWNEYVIRAEGKRIRLELNGYQTVDYTEADDSIKQTGLICLQIHGGPPSEARYKEITIEELPAHK